MSGSEVPPLLSPDVVSSNTFCRQVSAASNVAEVKNISTNTAIIQANAKHTYNLDNFYYIMFYPGFSRFLTCPNFFQKGHFRCTLWPIAFLLGFSKPINGYYGTLPFTKFHDKYLVHTMELQVILNKR